MPGSLDAWTKVSNEEIKPTVSRSRTIRDVFDSIRDVFDSIRDVFDSITVRDIYYTILSAGIFLLLCVLALIGSPVMLIINLTHHYYPRIRSFIRRQSTPTSSSTNPLVPRSPSRRPLVATSVHENNTIREFCWRICHFLDTCKNRAVFASVEEWRTRYRACVEVMASLVSFADVEARWFRHTLEALGEIGSFKEARKLSLSGNDEAYPSSAVHLLYFGLAPKHREFDTNLEREWSSERKRDLSSKLSFAADTLKQVEKFDEIMKSNVVKFDEVCQRITHELPGFDFDFPDSDPSLQQTLKLFGDPAKLGFMACRQPLKFFEYLNRIDRYRADSPNPEYERDEVIDPIFWPKHLLQRTLWSIDDIHRGGLGFSVEMFLLSLRPLLSTYPLQESYSALYIGTFRAITSDWRQYTRSIGTSRLLLDAVASEQGFLCTFDYPDYITDEIWKLLGDILEASHDHPWKRQYIIDDAVRQLTDVQLEDGYKYAAKAEALIALIS